MKMYLSFGSITIPCYGLCIVIGVLLANGIVFALAGRKGHNVFDWIVLEAYAFLGAFVGSKALYLLVSYQEIDWSRIKEISYLNQLMLSGFVFYGGLLGGLGGAWLAGKIHKIPAAIYLRDYIFLIPFVHAFGRIGCFMAGCCYGLPYNGPGAIRFPEQSLAPSQLSLFPIQLLEAGILLVLSLVLWIMDYQKTGLDPVFVYIAAYGVIRFGLEYLRYDQGRGHIGPFSVSQWISFVLVVGIYIWNLRKKYKTLEKGR